MYVYVWMYIWKLNIGGAAQILHSQIKQKRQINCGGQRVGRRLCRQCQLTGEVSMKIKGGKKVQINIEKH